MVSFNKIIVPVALATTALAAKNFYVAAASKIAVRVMTSARNPNIGAAQAASEVGHIIDGVLTYPPVDSLINKFLNMAGGPPPDAAQAKSLVHEVSSVLDKFQHDPSYPKYAAYVSQHLADFNIKKVIDVATSSAKRFVPLLGAQTSALLKAAKDPRIAEAVNTFSQLGLKFSKDFGLERFYKDLPTKW